MLLSSLLLLFVLRCDHYMIIAAGLSGKVARIWPIILSNRIHGNGLGVLVTLALTLYFFPLPNGTFVHLLCRHIWGRCGARIVCMTPMSPRMLNECFSPQGRPLINRCLWNILFTPRLIVCSAIVLCTGAALGCWGLTCIRPSISILAERCW